VQRRAPTMTESTSLGQFIDRNIERTLADCTSCGKCFEVCPMPAYAPGLQGKSPAAVVGGILDMLRGGAGSEDALEWTRICTQSASCIPACPEQVNPMMMMRLARMAALGSLGAPRRLQARDDPEFFLKILAYAKLQLSGEERAAWHAGGAAGSGKS